MGASDRRQRGDSTPGHLAGAALEPTLPLQHGEQLVVIDVSRRGNDAVSPIVPRTMQRAEILGGERLEGLAGP
jgi:hypothetical protein